MNILILRPEAGASRTAERARELGLAPIVAPIFDVQPVAWSPPDPALYEAVLVTSANAPRMGGEGLAAFTHLPCYAVGEGSAAAARHAGFTKVYTGPSDAEALAALAAGEGVSRALHLCAADHLTLRHPALQVEAVPVYSAMPKEDLPRRATEALERGAAVLLHSPRAAAHFARLLDHAGIARSGIGIVTISKAAAAAAGPGWGNVAVASEPRDYALLELAAKLCETGVHMNRAQA